MKRQHAIEVILASISDYIINDFPLQHLTGVDIASGPDAVNASELAEALEKMGCELAAIRVRQQITN